MLIKRESDLERYLRRTVKRYKGEVRKVKWIGRRNAPDDLILLNDRHTFIELKKLGKKPTGAQAREHLRMTLHGLCVVWTDYEAGVDRIIDAILNRTTPCSHYSKQSLTKT